jgi:hypothetical protein
VEATVGPNCRPPKETNKEGTQLMKATEDQNMEETDDAVSYKGHRWSLCSAPIQKWHKEDDFDAAWCRGCSQGQLRPNVAV